LAFCHYSVSHTSRSTGCSSVQSAAYMTGTKLHEQRRDLIVNYTTKADVSFAKTFAPVWASDDFRDTEKAWNAFENYEDTYAELRYKTPETQEKHKQTAQVCMKIVVALPKELSADVQEELLTHYIKKHFVEKGHVVTIGLHPEEGNPHAHLQISHRPLNQDSSISYTKNREMCSRFGLKQQRENWADTVNYYLEREGLSTRIDHRSYKDQGLDIIPTIHEGYHARNLELEGFQSTLCTKNRAIREENQQRIAEYPEIIFNELTAQKATFSELDLLKIVQNRTLDHPHLAQHVFESVLEKSIHVGHGFDQQKRFTSPDYFAQEETLLQGMGKLFASVVERKIHLPAIDSLINHSRAKGTKISEAQEQAIKILCLDSALSVLVGRAGTGKTTSVLNQGFFAHRRENFDDLAEMHTISCFSGQN